MPTRTPPAWRRQPATLHLQRPAWSRLLWALGLSVAVTACGTSETRPTQTGSYICKNNLTGLCEPCPGVGVCVDPNTCVVISCPAADAISFGGDDVVGDGASAEDAATLDAAATDSGPTDAGPTDAGPTDAGPADTGPTDTGPADTGPTDTGPVDTAVCNTGLKGCADKTTPQLCTDGQWLKLSKCEAGYACESGGCVCAKECVAVGQKACISGFPAVKTCELKDGCLRWSVPVACGATETCKAGVCAPANTGTLSCGQIMGCVSQNAQGPSDTVTINACIAKGTTAAQAEYKKRKLCIGLNCQKLIDAGKANDAMLCVYTKCAAEQTGCLGSGTQTCSQLGGCLSGCGTSLDCTATCHASASVQGVKDWYLLTTCGEQLCSGKTGNAYVSCVTQLCAASYQKCFGTGGGGSGGSGYSCAQVLQCAGTCTTKTCANACKAKASSAGLAALNALVACNAGPCGAYCGPTPSQACNTCMQTKCAKEQAACQ